MSTSIKPEKLYYTIGEVSKIAALPSSVLRYWETEFSGLKPIRHRSGKRLYRRKDIDRILELKKLLYEDRFTIEGARKALRGNNEKSEENLTPAPHASPSILVSELREEIKDILQLLQR